MEVQDSYRVLARKWRPQTFDDVVGQEHVTTTLKNAILQGRIGQGYLFIGTRGVGKTTIARILAKAVNCLSVDSPTPEPCGTCANCAGIRDGNCLDVVEIDGASNRSIDDIRRLRDTVSVAPVHARYKVYIIDEVHMLTREAFNALLKTLEEPPAHVKFFFATTEPHKIPATILSRVQKFELRRIEWPVLVDYMNKIAAAEKVDIEKGGIAAIARAGNGSVRDALSVFDQVLALADDHITEQQVVALLGWTDREIYFDLCSSLVMQNVNNALGTVQTIIDKGRDPEQFVLGFLQFLRDILVMKSVDNAERIIEDTPEYIETLRKNANHFTIEQLTYSIDVLLGLIPRLAATEAKQTALELVVLKLLQARRRVSLDDIFARLEALESGSVVSALEANAGAGAAAVSPSQAHAASPAAEIPAPRKLSPAEAWLSWYSSLESSDHKLFSMLHSATVSEKNSDALDIHFPSPDDIGLEALSDKKILQAVTKSVRAAAGRDITLTVSHDSPEPQKPRKATKAELIEKAKQIPSVKDALELFPGSEIIDVEE